MSAATIRDCGTGFVIAWATFNPRATFTEQVVSVIVYMLALAVIFSVADLMEKKR